MSKEKVWSIRLDIQILNHCGNLADAASIAGLAALCHARRPDVSLKGDEVTIHPTHERDPIPLAVHHHPVTTTFTMFQLPEQSSETMIVADPSLLEEECAKGRMVIGVNAYREVCTLHLAGQVMIDQRLVLRLARTAADKSKSVVEIIKQCLAEDEETGEKGVVRGFSGGLEEASILQTSILQTSAPRKMFDFSSIAKTAQSTMERTKEVEEVPCHISNPSENVVEIVPETMEADEESEESDMDSDLEITAEKTKDEVIKEKIKEHIDLDDSEEEETMTLAKV